MYRFLASPVRRLLAAIVLSVALFALGACGDLAASLPERPTAVPTLARLPSVTPVTPSPTPSATVPPTVTPTPVPLMGAVAVAANVRAGPGTDFEIVGVFDAGAPVMLLRRTDDWFEVRGPGDVSGWMFLQVLEIDPITLDAVPTDMP